MKFQNKNSFIGEWLNDTECGKETFTYQNGDKLYNDFKVGHLSCLGKITCSNGDTLRGKIKEGKRQFPRLNLILYKIGVIIFIYVMIYYQFIF